MERQHDLGTPEDTDPVLTGRHRTGHYDPENYDPENYDPENYDRERHGNGHRATDRAESEIDRVLPAMRGLRARARVTNLTRATQLERAVDSAADGRLDETGRAQAAAVAHQLIGSAGTFGFAEASRRAAELKDFFALADRGADDVALARARLSALRADLQSGEDDSEF